MELGHGRWVNDGVPRSRPMNVKRALARRLDARYARRSALENLRSELRNLRQEVLKQQDLWETLSQRVETLQRDTRASASEMAQLRPRINEGHRMAIESSRAIETLLETELRHRQVLDSLTGEGR